MQLKTFFIVAIIVGAIGLYAYRGYDAPPAQMGDLYQGSYGIEQGKGNVVGIEPQMEPADYSSQQRFQEKLTLYFEAAKESGYFTDKTIVLLPEHIGTWLVAMDANPAVFGAATTDGAMANLILKYPMRFLKNYLTSSENDPLQSAVFLSRIDEVTMAFQAVMRNLAKGYQVAIVAGSVVARGDDGHLYNRSETYLPDGSLLGRSDKVHPIPSEVGFVSKYPAGDNHAQALMGRDVLTLVCADSWHGDSYQGSADVLLVPSFLTDTSWDSPWQGYVNDTAALDNRWQDDVGRITEGQAWQKYALATRAREMGARFGMNVFLKGHIWNIKGAGHALIWKEGYLHVGAAREDQPAIYNLWLE